MKKLFIILFAAVAMPVLFSSCEREVDFNDTGADAPTLEQKAIDLMEANEPAQLDNARCFPAFFTVTPCDDRFRVQVLNSGGIPLSYNCPYYIFTQSWSLVDNGTVSHNQYTNSVLNYCTSYRVYIYDPCSGTWKFQNVTSDGCNNTFVC